VQIAAPLASPVVAIHFDSSRQVVWHTAKWTSHEALNLSVKGRVLAPYSLQGVFCLQHRRSVPPLSSANASTARILPVRSATLGCRLVMHLNLFVSSVIHQIDYQSDACWFCAQSPPIGLTVHGAPTFLPHAPL